MTPCYNEAATVARITEAVLAPPFVGQLIIADDCSTDGTPAIIGPRTDGRITTLLHEVNQGKGAALRTGFAAAELDLVIVQDADLEYTPYDYPVVPGPLLDGHDDVVYGSRFKGGSANRVLYFRHSAGNGALTTASNMMTNLSHTEIETCFKAFRREVLQSFTIEENRFRVEPEITAKIAQLGVVVYEVGITYEGRTYSNGKRVIWKDGLQAIFCILVYCSLGQRVRMNRLSQVLSRAIGRKQ